MGDTVSTNYFLSYSGEERLGFSDTPVSMILSGIHSEVEKILASERVPICDIADFHVC